MTITPENCVFDHPGMKVLEGAVFRLTEGDQVPAMAIRLDQTDALVPLEALRKLLDIERDSADGQLLHLIGQGLRFVPVLRMGDPLPPEVLTGEASWQPSDYHRQVASARLQMQLLNWLRGGAEETQITSQMLVVSVDDPSIRPRVQQALRRAAQTLGITGGGPAVAVLIEELAEELAYVEALRERLLVRVQGLTRRLHRLGQDLGQIAAARRETLFQVTRLAATGLGQILGRFELIDGGIADIMSALRDLEERRAFLRPHRDWLYCTQLGWERLLLEWEAVPGVPAEERLWRMLEKAYRFLAPRYMTVQEWHAAPSNGGGERARAVVW